MVDPTDEIARQARQGSVAAIIQLLNEQLASSGVRTRAIRENGVLEMLCEAESVEQIEQTTLVPRIREILETIRPSNIRRVKINCRIVREQQSLWLEEISRDPENHLLWFEEITLTRRNPFKRLATDMRERNSKSVKPSQLKPSSPFERDRRQLRRGMLGGILMSGALLLGGWAAYKALAPKQGDRTQATKPESSTNLSPNQQTLSVANQTNSPNVSGDPFAAAVRLAEQASVDGKKAQTRAQWLEIANRWQQASDMMGQVPATDRRYQTALNRKSVYRKNSESALRQLQKRRS
ncbi:hypothetical protein [Argonema antarcticum]|uniref:hypothetical protein n=1 Tax=Argonema antarcticum TaxID=2942763 RepID=UPI0020120947|nr:hypothetical protein [Argonema antarcticum]MCL1470364.1 hypothetical protein [Argonema antarcticum A004/B2]